MKLSMKPLTLVLLTLCASAKDPYKNTETTGTYIESPDQSHTGILMDHCEPRPNGYFYCETLNLRWVDKKGLASPEVHEWYTMTSYGGKTLSLSIKRKPSLWRRIVRAIR